MLGIRQLSEFDRVESFQLVNDSYDLGVIRANGKKFVTKNRDNTARERRTQEK